MTTETVFLKEFTQLSERKCGASGAIYKPSWTARFFYSSLRPAGVKTTIIQSKREHRILPVLPLLLFIQSN